MIANLHKNMMEPLNRFGDSLDTLRSSFLLRFLRVVSSPSRAANRRKDTQTKSRNTPPNRL